MFFDREDIEKEIGSPAVINADKFIDRITDAVREKFVYVPDYQNEEKVRLAEAEKFLLNMYQLLKEE